MHEAIWITLVDSFKTVDNARVNGVWQRTSLFGFEPLTQNNLDGM